MEVKENIKLILNNILYFICINIILFVCHFWAFSIIKYNTVGITYDSLILVLLPTTIALVPLIIGSIILSVLFNDSNNKFKMKIFWILQGIVILSWFIVYIITFFEK